MVGTTNRSMAAMPSAWLRRNVFHPCEGGPLLRARYLATLVWPISMPSLRSSPRILGAPHNGLAMLISRISRRISNGTVGRPQRRCDFQRQYDLKPARCQRITVSGFTIVSALMVFGTKRYSPTRIRPLALSRANRPAYLGDGPQRMRELVQQLVRRKRCAHNGLNVECRGLSRAAAGLVTISVIAVVLKCEIKVAATLQRWPLVLVRRWRYVIALLIDGRPLVLSPLAIELGAVLHPRAPCRLPVGEDASLRTVVVLEPLKLARRPDTIPTRFIGSVVYSLLNTSTARSTNDRLRLTIQTDGLAGSGVLRWHPRTETRFS
jgi:hypothetical protein